MIQQLSSTEFRLRYTHLVEPCEVTVNGRVIGRWTPAVTTVPETPLRGPGADATYRKLQVKK